MNDQRAQLPLEDFTLIEFSSMITASLASMMAAEQGARVIKVEPTGVGDIMRLLGTSKGGISGLFANCNRGKESVALNLKDPQGLALAKRLASQADVLITNYRPGVMEKLGLGSESLRTADERLIYVAISGFGTQGPLKNEPAYDPVVQAQAGFTDIQGASQPELIRNLICDKITAHAACQALTAALLQRTRTGKGQHIDLSMLDAGFFFMFPDGFMNQTLLDEDVEVLPDLTSAISVASAKNGFFSMSPVTPAQRSGMHRALGLKHLDEDPRFASTDAMLQNFVAYREALQHAFDAVEVDELVERLRAEGVPAAKCMTREEALDQTQFSANATLETVHHPIMGKMKQVRSPARFQGRALPLGKDCPALGEDTARVLSELGVDDEALRDLQAQGVVG